MAARLDLKWVTSSSSSFVRPKNRNECPLALSLSLRRTWTDMMRESRPDWMKDWLRRRERGRAATIALANRTHSDLYLSFHRICSTYLGGTVNLAYNSLWETVTWGWLKLSPCPSKPYFSHAGQTELHWKDFIQTHLLEADIQIWK